MKQPELSIIIPAYNAQESIIPCLDSIMRQDGIRQFEIIVVNDGSSDDTGKIVQQYRTGRPNIQLINQLNNGVSVARNNGMRVSRGKFVTFVDADDIVGISYAAQTPWVRATRTERLNAGPMQISITDMGLTPQPVQSFETGYFTNMLNAIDDDTDIAMGGKISLDFSRNIMSSLVYNQQGEFCTSATEKSMAINHAALRESANFAIYRHDFLHNQNLWFQPMMQLDEDILFCMLAILHARKIVTVPNATYLYFRRGNTASTPNQYRAAYDLSAIQLYSAFLNALYEYPLYDEIFNTILMDFKLCGNIAESHTEHFPNTICNKCNNTVNPKCMKCGKLRKLLDINIRTFLTKGR